MQELFANYHPLAPVELLCIFIQQSIQSRINQTDGEPITHFATYYLLSGGTTNMTFFILSKQHQLQGKELPSTRFGLYTRHQEGYLPTALDWDEVENNHEKNQTLLLTSHYVGSLYPSLSPILSITMFFVNPTQQGDTSSILEGTRCPSITPGNTNKGRAATSPPPFMQLPL